MANEPVMAGERSDGGWRGFVPGNWQGSVDVRDFIQQNYTPYDGDESFLAPATKRTLDIWGRLTALFPEERKKGVLDVSQVLPSASTVLARIDQVIQYERGTQQLARSVRRRGERREHTRREVL